jgi:uncharacterized membrane protein
MSTGWAAVLYLHLLAMAFFVGGQLILAAVVVPVLGGERDPAAMRSLARRFGAGSLVALAFLLATGIAMAEHFSLWSSGTLQLKLALVVLVIALTLIHTRLPRAHALHGLILLASLAIVWLGVDLSR